MKEDVKGVVIGFTTVIIAGLLLLIIGGTLAMIAKLAGISMYDLERYMRIGFFAYAVFAISKYFRRRW